MYCEHTNASLNTEATCRRYTTPPHSTFSEFTEAIKVQTTTALVAQVCTRECLMSNVVKCLRMFPFQCNWNCILNVLCVPERKTQNSLQNSCQILTNFHILFHWQVPQKMHSKAIIKDSTKPKHAATLPCDICVSHITEHNNWEFFHGTLIKCYTRIANPCNQIIRYYWVMFFETTLVINLLLCPR